jgi:predicted phage terminase large subunit-like protein
MVATVEEQLQSWDCAFIRTMSANWPHTLAKLIEDKANGSAVIQMMSKDIPGILAVNPEGGKVARAAAVSPMIEAGNVYLPHPQFMPWVTDFIEECAAFPNATHDDQVDAMTQGLLRWNQVPQEVVWCYEPYQISPI